MSSDSSSSALSSTTVTTANDKTVVKWVKGVAEKEAKKPSTIILIARDEDAKQAAKNHLRSALNKKSYSGLLITTPVDLQTTIDNIKGKDKPGALIMLFGAGIVHTEFDVPGVFSELQVHRAAPDSTNEKLVIKGSSTYHDVRLDKWEKHRHKKHAIKLGFQNGVRIGVDGIMNMSNPDWCKARNNLSEDERADLDKNFEQVRRHKNDWGAVKGYVAAIVGLLVGTTKFAAGISATAGGIYAKYAFGVHAVEIGMAGAKVTAVATAAGPAVVLGVAATAAIYFIPLNDVYDWLKGALMWMWEKVKDIWSSFITLLKRFLGVGQDRGKERSFPHRGTKPMAF